MFDRRSFIGRSIGAAVVTTGSAWPMTAAGQEVEPEGDEFAQLINPPIESIDAPVKFGYKPPSQDQIDRVEQIIKETKGSTPYEVANSFVTRFYSKDRDVISQWPAPAAWNPLIVRFFREATSLKANNDMVDWCAAFANWCIKTAGKHSTNSAASQSFVSPANAKYFKRVSEPKVGNLVVYTCYNMSGKSLGLGHVGFYAGPSGAGSISLLSGNTARDGRSSLICVKSFSTGDRNVYRTVNKVRVPCVMRLNAYLEIL